MGCNAMRSWFEVEVRVPPELGEAICNRMFELGSTGLELEEGADSVLVRAYFPTDSSEHPAQELGEYLRALRADHSVVRWRAVNEEQWADSWKQWFQPIAVGRHLWITPPWHEHSPPGRVTLTIEPGMAFGTGHHASTVGCLELIEEVLATDRIVQALDLGTGSGILAIAMAKLGVPEIRASDIDPIALGVARDNVARNGVQAAVTVESTWELGQGIYDLVAANLYRNALEELAERLATVVRQPGHLVCAGFFDGDVAAVIDAYASYGFAPERHWQRDEWAALWLRRG
jgi:ribosomal protein L11 methyltransferase